MITTRFTLLIAAALTAALSACSTTTSVDPTSGTATVALSPSTSSESPVADTTHTPSTIETTDPATSETPATTEATAPSPVDGFGLVGQDLANAQAAWATYERYDAFYKQAVANPRADWSAQLADLTGDPLIVNAQSALTRQAQLEQVVNNQLKVELTKVSTFPDYVLFEGCFDNTRTTILDKDGNDVKAPNAPGSYYRTPGEIEVDIVNEKWVTVIINIPDRNVSC